MPDFATHDDFVEHSRRVGHPAGALPPAVRDAYAAAGIQAPAILNLQLGVITPPHVGDGKPPHCVHCGRDVPEGQHPRAFAVEGFEDARHPASGQPLRLQVLHCDDCLGGPGCSPEAREPQGHRVGGGYCHDLGEEA